MGRSSLLRPQMRHHLTVLTLAQTKRLSEPVFKTSTKTARMNNSTSRPRERFSASRTWAKNVKYPCWKTIRIQGHLASVVTTNVPSLKVSSRRWAPTRAKSCSQLQRRSSVTCRLVRSASLASTSTRSSCAWRRSPRSSSSGRILPGAGSCPSSQSLTSSWDSH